jgi:hypothetical protein
MTPIQMQNAMNALEQMGIHTTEHLTPEAMMVYLETRLSSLDDEINELFEKQEIMERIKEAVKVLQNSIAGADPEKKLKLDGTQRELMMEALNQIKELDPLTYAKLEEELLAADILNLKDGELKWDKKLNPEQLEAFGQILDGVASKIDSSAQLEMILLQSLMSERQTFIQISTNTVATLGQSDQAIAGNFR